MSTLKPFIRTFNQAEPYEQDEPGEAHFSWLLNKDEVPGLQIGRVQLKGPIHKTPAAHDEWHQAYVILQGTGYIHLGNDKQRITGPSVIVIPKNTRHSVEVPDGEQLEYAFINQYN